MPDIVSTLNHLGKGWALPLNTNAQGGIRLSATRKNIEESIQIILRTRLGERVYRPDFGSRLSELTFAPLSTDTLLLIRLYVQEALNKWEPRIRLDLVETEPDPICGRVNILIHYHPRDTHEKRSLVYPFFILPAAE